MCCPSPRVSTCFSSRTELTSRRETPSQRWRCVRGSLHTRYVFTRDMCSHEMCLAPPRVYRRDSSSRTEPTSRRETPSQRWRCANGSLPAILLNWEIVREVASSMVAAGATANTTKENSRTYRELGCCVQIRTGEIHVRGDPYQTPIETIAQRRRGCSLSRARVNGVIIYLPPGGRTGKLLYN